MEEEDFNALAQLLAGPRTPIIPRNQQEIFGLPSLSFPSQFGGNRFGGNFGQFFPRNSQIPLNVFNQGANTGLPGGSLNTGLPGLEFFLNQRSPAGVFDPFLNPGLPGGS